MPSSQSAPWADVVLDDPNPPEPGQEFNREDRESDAAQRAELDDPSGLRDLSRTGQTADVHGPWNGGTRTHDGLSGLLQGGHGYLVRKVSTLGPSEQCRYCPNPVLTMDDQYPCELAPYFERCQCNGCISRRWGIRKSGNQPETCGSVDCERKRKRENKADQRARDDDRARELAALVIRQDPARSDKDIAAELGIRPKRVKEARQKSGHRNT